MKKIEYLKCIDELDLDKSEYCIISGGVMLMYDLKEETEDVDIKIRPSYFPKLSQKFEMSKSPKYDYLYDLSDNVEVAVLDFDDDDVEWIEGYPVESLQKQLEWKLANNREKDQESIKIIQQYLDNKKAKC